jgi:transcriptional regulator with XRE-family HTH domain
MIVDQGGSLLSYKNGEWQSLSREAEDVMAVVAKVLGVSQPTLSDYERGTKQPRIAQAARIAERTDGQVPLDAWLDGASQGSSHAQ